MGYEFEKYRFRVPYECQNGHPRFLFSVFVDGIDNRYSWGIRHAECNCPTGGIGQGFHQSGTAELIGIMNMTDTELIAKQAREIAELKARIVDFVTMTKNIRSQLYSIGAPLNDNVLGYSNKQLGTFIQIGNETDDMVLPEEWN